MFRRNIHFLACGGIGILLVALVVIFNHYRNSPPQDPVIIYKTTFPTKRGPKQEKMEVPEKSSQQGTDRMDDADVETQQITETKASEEEFPPELEEFDDFQEPLPTTQGEEPPKEDPRILVLKEVFPELDRLLRETQELMEDMKAGKLEDFAQLETKGQDLENQLQEYCRLISEVFPGSVNFITWQGQQWAYDVDFRFLQDSLQGAIPSELEGYFRYESMREMLGMPEIPPDQLQELQR